MVVKESEVHPRITEFLNRIHRPLIQLLLQCPEETLDAPILPRATRISTLMPYCIGDLIQSDTFCVFLVWPDLKPEAQATKLTVTAACRAFRIVGWWLCLLITPMTSIIQAHPMWVRASLPWQQ